MAKSNSKSLRGQAKAAGIDVKKLFPRSKINLNRKFTPYQARKIKKAILEKELHHKSISNVIYPDRPEHYEKAGFIRRGKKILQTNDKIKIHTVYKHEGDSSFYSASFFGGQVNAQLIPINKLHDFLIQQADIDAEQGQWYDKISLKENDRDMWGQAGGFSNTHDSAEEFLLYLDQYKRHGALIGEGQTFEYIQVCFINFGG